MCVQYFFKSDTEMNMTDCFRSGGGLHSAGLSVSHDSVFSPEQRSGAESGSELESSSSLSIQRSLYLTQSGVQVSLFVNYTLKLFV